MKSNIVFKIFAFAIWTLATSYEPAKLEKVKITTRRPNLNLQLRICATLSIVRNKPIKMRKPYQNHKTCKRPLFPMWWKILLFDILFMRYSDVNIIVFWWKRPWRSCRWSCWARERRERSLSLVRRQDHIWGNDIDSITRSLSEDTNWYSGLFVSSFNNE